MDFNLGEEQSLLLASCERLVRDQCGFDARRRHAGADPRAPSPVWSEIQGLGLPALCVPASAGGLGFALIDGALVAQALGAGWLLDPFVDSALAAPALLAAAPASAARDELLGRVGGGAIAVMLPASAAAAHASYAEVLLARVGERLVAVEASRVERHPYRQFDGTAAARVDLAPGSGVELADGPAAAAAWRAGTTAARIGRIAEGVGLARKVLDVTTEYLRTRTQFGQPIGRFQALGHRMADLLIELEQMQSLAWAAAMRPDDRTVDAAQLIAHRALRTIGQQAIQLHGGIGMADETPVSHYVKRMLAIELELGDADTVMARFSGGA